MRRGAISQSLLRVHPVGQARVGSGPHTSDRHTRPTEHNSALFLKLKSTAASFVNLPKTLSVVRMLRLMDLRRCMSERNCIKLRTKGGFRLQLSVPVSAPPRPCLASCSEPPSRHLHFPPRLLVSIGAHPPLVSQSIVSQNISTGVYVYARSRLCSPTHSASGLSLVTDDTRAFDMFRAPTLPSVNR